MKTENQIRHFLSSQTFKTEADRKMIAIFIKQQKYSVPVPTTLSDDGLDIATFTDWFNNGFGAGEVARMGENLVILGNCSLHEAETLVLKAAYGFKINKVVVGTRDLLKVEQSENKACFRALSQHGLQYDAEKNTIIPKYKPYPSERVMFWNDEIKGLGVIRTFDPENNFVELFCYYIYQTNQIGYSMHETGVCTAHDFNFQPMTVSETRRLNRELEKYGKVWYDKLHRIEPLKVKVDKGEAYWYIDDKMKIIKTWEKETPTSRYRYIAGNYFTSYPDALECMGKIADILRDKLAKPEEKKIEGQ